LFLPGINGIIKTRTNFWPKIGYDFVQMVIKCLKLPHLFDNKSVIAQKSTGKRTLIQVFGTLDSFLLDTDSLLHQ